MNERQPMTKGKRSQVEARLAAGNSPKDSGAKDRAGHLRADVGRLFRGREAPPDNQPDRNGGIEVTAGNVADHVCHRQHRQSKGQSYAGEANTETGECRRQHSAAASAKTSQEVPGSSAKHRLRSGMFVSILLATELAPESECQPSRLSLTHANYLFQQVTFYTNKLRRAGTRFAEGFGVSGYVKFPTHAVRSGGGERG
jgi:hypothetical protein